LIEYPLSLQKYIAFQNDSLDDFNPLRGGGVRVDDFNPVTSLAWVRSSGDALVV
jgi:hypothetical protein